MSISKINISLIVLCILFLSSCHDNSIELFDGASQIHFVQEEGNIIVDETNPIYSIEVGVIKPVDVDRTFSIIINENSSAKENMHFELLDNEVSIPAGEVFGNIEIKCLFEDAEPEGLDLYLSLDSSNAEEVAEFKDVYRVGLFKFCTFDRDAFVGTYYVYEHAFNGEFEYEVEIEAGDEDDPYSIFVTGLWAVDESAVQIVFDRKSTDCSIPDQFFFDEPSNGYNNAWIRSLSNGTYNSCLGSIEGLEYFVYPKDAEDNKGWDRGTFDMYKIE